MVRTFTRYHPGCFFQDILVCGATRHKSILPRRSGAWNKYGYKSFLPRHSGAWSNQIQVDSSKTFWCVEQTDISHFFQDTITWSTLGALSLRQIYIIKKSLQSEMIAVLFQGISQFIDEGLWGRNVLSITIATSNAPINSANDPLW